VRHRDAGELNVGRGKYLVDQCGPGYVLPGHINKEAALEHVDADKDLMSAAVAYNLAVAAGEGALQDQALLPGRELVIGNVDGLTAVEGEIYFVDHMLVHAGRLLSCAYITGSAVYAETGKELFGAIKLYENI
jgi:hypothetical protein